jgi:O-methyltransferase involved in polyketide biosynthesis
MTLSQISRTAILLLICRAVEHEKNPSAFNDPMAALIFDRLVPCISKEDRHWIMQKKKMYAGIEEHDAVAGVRRGQAFDRIANRFIANHPNCTVVNLACGFDTRFWRIDYHHCAYLELDLPEIIQLKKDLLKDHLEYEMIGCSVLDTSWIDRVTRGGNQNFLLIAEGLFMWFAQQEVARVLKEMAERFSRTQIVLDMVPEKFTRGIWKPLLRIGFKLDWGLDVSWAYGIKQPQELEAFSSGLKVVGVEKGSAGPIITVSINSPAD